MCISIMFKNENWLFHKPQKKSQFWLGITELNPGLILEPQFQNWSGELKPRANQRLINN
jgi:hypothetical protein